MTLAQVPLLRSIASMVAVGGLIIAGVLLTAPAKVEYDGSVYREGDGGVFGVDSYDLTVTCAPALAGIDDVGTSDVDEATYDEAALVDAPLTDDFLAPTTLAPLTGDLYVDRTDVLVVCGRVRDQRLAVAGALVALGLTLLGLVAGYSVARRRRPA